MYDQMSLKSCHYKNNFTSWIENNVNMEKGISLTLTNKEYNNGCVLKCRIRNEHSTSEKNSQVVKKKLNWGIYIILKYRDYYSINSLKHDNLI